MQSVLRKFFRLPLGRAFAATIPFIIVLCVLAAATAGAEPDTTPGNVEIEYAQSLEHAQSLARAFQSAANTVRPSVVAVVNVIKSDGAQPTQSLNSLFSNPQPFFNDMPELPLGERVVSGSGVLMDAAGVVLTNRHVIAEPGEVTIRLADNRRYRALEILSDARTDLAVIRFRAPAGLQAARMGDSDQLSIGDWVLAIGHPFGLKNTVTAGIVSARDRELQLQPDESYLQTDAAINPGNSGGPLANLRGEIIGINTAISSHNGGYQGAGFAMPINHARWVSEQLLSQGRVSRGYLGISIQENTTDLAEQFGLTTASGVLVTDAASDSPGGRAGVRRGDVIVEYAGQPVRGIAQLRRLVERTPGGECRPMTIVRQREPLEIMVSPGVRREVQQPDVADRRAIAAQHVALNNGFGLSVRQPNRGDLHKLGLAAGQGVAIDSVASNSPAQIAGMKPGMAVLEVDRQPVRSTEEFQAAMTAALQRGTALLLLRNGQRNSYVVLRPGPY